MTIAPGQSVSFSGSGTDPENNTPFTYLWTFGAGGPPNSTAQNPGAVTFPNTGVYTVTFTVTDSLGLADPTPATRTITVGSGSGPITLIPQASWTLRFVDSEETFSWDGAGTNAFDNNPNTSWVTQFTDGGPGLPHEIQIDLGAVENLTQFRYLPHQAFQAGRVGAYEFYVSMDGFVWGDPVAAGAFPDTNSGAVRDVLFVPTSGRYVRFRALSEVNNGAYTFTALGELNLFRAGTGSNQAPTVSVTSPAADLTIVAGSAIRLSGTASDPDGHLPLTYQWRVGPNAGITDRQGPQPGYVQFDRLGTFIVTLTVADALGKTAAVSRTVDRALSGVVSHSLGDAVAAHVPAPADIHDACAQVPPPAPPSGRVSGSSSTAVRVRAVRKPTTTQLPTPRALRVSRDWSMSSRRI